MNGVDYEVSVLLMSCYEYLECKSCFFNRDGQNLGIVESLDYMNLGVSSWLFCYLFNIP